MLTYTYLIQGLHILYEGGCHTETIVVSTHPSDDSTPNVQRALHDKLSHSSGYWTNIHILEVTYQS